MKTTPSRVPSNNCIPMKKIFKVVHKLITTMNDDINYHLPVGNRSYRIQRSTGVNAYLQKCWPHHQHRFLAYMIYKSFGHGVDIVLQKELINIFKLNKGVVSATIKKMVRRNHIEQISKIRPYWYRLTIGGEQYARYILTHFPKYNLNIFHYFDKTKIRTEDIHCIDQSSALLEKVEEIFGPNNISITIEIRLSDLSCEIPLEFTRLFVKFSDMSLDERDTMLKNRNCENLTKLYWLLEEEIQIRYRLMTLIKLDEYIRNLKKNSDKIEKAFELENELLDHLTERYSEPSHDEKWVKPIKIETIPTEYQGSNSDEGLTLLENMKSMMEIFSPPPERSKVSGSKEMREMEHKLRMANLELKREKKRSKRGQD